MKLLRPPALLLSAAVLLAAGPALASRAEGRKAPERPAAPKAGARSPRTKLFSPLVGRPDPLPKLRDSQGARAGIFI